MPNSIPDQALVVVADGGKALLFRHTVSGDHGRLHQEQMLTPQSLTAQGPAGSRPGDQSPRQTDEASFANHLAHVLHTMHQHGEFRDLVLVVDPQTLGTINGCLHKTVAATIVRTLAKDLTNHPQKAIESALLD